MIVLDDIRVAPESVLRVWYRTLPAPKTDEERDVVEALAARCEGLGMIDGNGRLKG